MKLPALRLPCEVEQPPTSFATNLGYSVRIIDGSVWRVKPLRKICHGTDAAIWIEKNLIDQRVAYFLAAACREQRIASGYDHNTAIAEERNRAKGKRRSA